MCKTATWESRGEVHPRAACHTREGGFSLTSRSRRSIRSSSSETSSSNSGNRAETSTRERPAKHGRVDLRKE